MSREGKKEWNCWYLLYVFSSRDLAGKIMKKVILSTIIQIRGKTANATQDQIKFERWK